MYDACLTNSYTSLDQKFLRPNSNFSFSWPENLLEIYARTLASYGNKMRQTELKTSVSLPSSNSCSAGLYTDATSSLPIYSVRAFRVMKRHHYPLIPRAPCSGKSRFHLVYILYILTVSTLLPFTLYTREL